MDWNDVGKKLLGLGLPILGAALPLPGGMALGSALANAIGSSSSSPADIIGTLTASADAVERAKEFALTHQETILKITVGAEVAESQSVNTTMQAEARADHWPTYSWRPFIGFMFGAYIASMWLLPLAGKQPIEISTDLTLAVGSILGIASYFRGKAQADPAIATDNRG